MAALAQMVGVCIVRNGENCKRCVYYGKPCESFKAHHRGKKPKDLDDVKSEEQRKFFKKQNEDDRRFIRKHEQD